MRFCLTFQSTTFVRYVSGAHWLWFTLDLYSYVRSNDDVVLTINIETFEFYTHMHDDCTRTCSASIIIIVLYFMACTPQCTIDIFSVEV